MSNIEGRMRSSKCSSTNSGVSHRGVFPIVGCFPSWVGCLSSGFDTERGEGEGITGISLTLASS